MCPVDIRTQRQQLECWNHLQALRHLSLEIEELENAHFSNKMVVTPLPIPFGCRTLRSNVIDPLPLVAGQESAQLGGQETLFHKVVWPCHRPPRSCQWAACGPTLLRSFQGSKALRASSGACPGGALFLVPPLLPVFTQHGAWEGNHGGCGLGH